MGILGQIENDVTVQKDQNPVEGSENLGLSTTEQKEQKTIVLDGPLSTLYTKALNLVFSKNENEDISTETQQMDSVLVADIHEFAKKKEKIKSDNLDKAAYVYVTDSDRAIQYPAQTFDDLRIALDMDTTGEKIICIECIDENKVERLSTLINYVESHACQPKLFFKRTAAIDYLSH